MLHMFRILKNTEMLTMQCTRWMVRIYSEIECQSSTVKEDVIEGKEDLRGGRGVLFLILTEWKKDL